nr:retrotransposon protein, putative, Ty1-copia subclass [Tanacetum cinerariifolium]
MDIKRKIRPDNNIEKFKARLLIALASIYEVVIHQMDVKTAFLNSDLEEEIYIEQPEGLAELANASDTYVFSKVIGSDCVIICLYVDDMLILGNKISVVNEIKTFLSSQFEMKDLGEVDVILGIIVRKTENGYSLSQSYYIEKTCIACFTMEAEFIALELAGQEVEWLRNLLADIEAICASIYTLRFTGFYWDC